MVARGPGAVGCAHCTKLGGIVACAVCKHLVCEACAADWATCDQPSGRIVRLGLSGRLIDLDPSGRYGLANFWRGPLRLVDLRALRWIPEPDMPKTYPRWREVGPRMTSDGRLVTPRYVIVDDTVVSRWLEVRRLGDELGVGKLEDIPTPLRHSRVTATHDWYYYVTDAERVAIVSPRAPVDLPETAAPVHFLPIRVPDLVLRELDPLPRKVLQAVHVDAARALIATASWGEIIVHRITSETLEPERYVKTTGDVAWVALGGPYLAARVKGGADGGITVRRLDDAQVVLRVEGGPVAALSRDGRYLAVGHADSRVVVHAINAQTAVTFDEHTAEVSFVAFVGDDHLLVTADDDNRVIVRPRTPTGYATALLETELA